MKLLLIANTYTTLTIASNISFVSDRITELIILNESLVNTESLFACDAKIILLDSVAKAISECDLIWIFQDGKIPKHKIYSIEQLASHYQKPVFELLDPWIQANNELKGKSMPFIESQQDSIPKILIISMGEWTQLYSLETWIAKKLINEGATIQWTKSAGTAHLFRQISQIKLLNKIHENDYCNKTSDISLASFECPGIDYPEFGWDNARKLYYSDADITILIIDFCFLDYISLIEFERKIYYRYGIIPDSIIVSNFRKINISESQCNYMICNKEIAKNEHYCKLCDNELPSLINNILNKIRAPQGISDIHF